MAYAGTPPPVLESELELLSKHRDAGDSIRVIQCSGGLSNCHWNIDHNNRKCDVCRSRFQNGWEYVNPGRNSVLKNFPARTWLDNSSMPEFKSVDDINQFNYDGLKIGYGVTASLVSILRDHRFDTRIHRDLVLRTLNSAIQVYESLKSEFEDFKPDRVYFFNGRVATHLPAKLLCKKLGIEFYSYELSQQENCYRLFKNKTIHDVVSVLDVKELSQAWNEEKEAKGSAYLRLMRMGKDLGKLPVYTTEQRQGVLPDGFNSSLRNIAIFNGTIDEYAGIENAKNRLYQPDETSGIARILESFENDEKFFFYLRVHPHMKGLQDTTSQLADIRQIQTRFTNIKIIWPDDVVDSYALMDACEKVVTFGSTTGIEATFWGKPSILADQARFENFNYAYMPKTHEDMIELIRDNLNPLPAIAAIKIIYSVAYDGIQFKYFEEVFVNNESSLVTLQGNSIKGAVMPRLLLWMESLPLRLKLLVMQPEHIFSKVKYRLRKVFLFGVRAMGK